MSAPTATDCPSEVGPRLHSIGTRWKSDSLWVLAGSIADFLSQGGLFIVLSRLTNPEVVGHFAGALALASPVFMLLSLQLRSLILSDVARSYRLSDAAFLRCLTVAIASAVTLAIAGASNVGPSLSLAVWGAICFKSSDALAELSMVQFQRERQFRLATYQQVARAIAILFTGTLAALHFRSAAGVSMAAGIGSLIAAGLVLYGVRWFRIARQTPHPSARLQDIPYESLRPEYRPVALRQLVGSGLPLGFVMGLISLLSSIPRLYLEKSHGSATLGLFAASGFVSAGAMMLVNAACQPATQQLAMLYASGRFRDYYGLLRRLVVLAGVIGCFLVGGALIFGDLALTLLFGPIYAGQTDVLVWQFAATGVAFVTASLGTAATAAHRFAPQTLIMLMTVAVCAVACEFLVPTFGAPGAAAASFIAWCCCCAGYFCILPVNREST